MKCYPALSFIFLLLTGFSPIDTKGNQPYFQQQVNIEIEATLNDADATLAAHATIEYINNSTDTLKHIIFHLWANGYKNNETAFAEQLLKSGETDFHTALPTEKGGYTHIEFRSGNSLLNWSNYQEHQDIALVYLDQPLLPRDTALLNIQYTLTFPHARFSRLGHHNQSFYATQWYPKPAVYNTSGWQAMPYLDRGEFFSEFGTMKVCITLPENYIVASTAVLQNQKEIDFLTTLARKTAMQGEDAMDASAQPPASSEEMKTLCFIMENTHDFAWFADKQFRMLEKQVSLTNGQQVNCQVFFTHDASQWQKASDYLAQAVVYMSDLIGTYPWKEIKAVQGIYSGGANMEYPGITVIGEKTSDKDLERVIVHEVIHNWFYGILANNERKDPWLDEGFSTYYERRFFEMKYPEEPLLGNLSYILPVSLTGLGELKSTKAPYLWYMLKAAQHLDQPPGAHSTQLSALNYYAMTYFKAAMAIAHLGEYLGRDRFDKIMREYYRRWQFKHPSVKDLKDVFDIYVDDDLNWFFNGLIGSSKKVDIAIAGFSEATNGYMVRLQNRGEIPLPFTLSAFRGNDRVASMWIEQFSGKKQVEVPVQNVSHFTIDHNRQIPDIRRKNNLLKTSGLFRRGNGPSLAFLGALTDPQKNRIFWAPVVGYNSNDGIMPGMAFYNYVFPVASTDFFFMPFYSTRRDAFSGTAWLYRDLYPKSGRIHSLRIGTKYKTYGLAGGNMPLAYHAAETSLQVNINVPLSNKRISTYARITNFLISRELWHFPSGIRQVKTQRYYANRLDIIHNNQQLPQPYSFGFSLLQGKDMIRASISAEALYPLFQNFKGLHVRFFAGKFLLAPSDPSYPDFRFSLQGPTPSRSPLFEHQFLGFNSAPGTFWGNQVAGQFGAFKFPSPVGLTWNWLVAVNLALDLPAIPLVRLYFDTGTYHLAGQQIINSERFPWVGGLQLKMFNDLLQINFPVVISADIKRIAELNKLDDYLQRVTFSVQLQRLNLMEARRKIHLHLF